jgi:tetratricopeptide (TPR) repeat protein
MLCRSVAHLKLKFVIKNQKKKIITMKNIATKFINSAMVVTILTLIYACNYKIHSTRELVKCDSHKDLGFCPHKRQINLNHAISEANNSNGKGAINIFNNQKLNYSNQPVQDDTLDYQIAQLHARTNNYSIALKQIENINEAIGQYFYYNKGVYQLKSGLYADAIISFRNHLELCSSMFNECHWGIGYSQLKLGQYDLAIEEFQIFLKAKENVDVRLCLVEALFRINERGKAIEELKLAVIKHPGNKKSRVYLVNYLLQDNLLNKAIIINSISFRNKEYTNIITQANILFKKGKFSRAFNKYNEAFHMNQNGHEAIEGLLISSYALGDMKKYSTYNKLLGDSTTGNQMLLEIQAIQHFKNNEFEKAKVLFNRIESFGIGYSLSYDGLICRGFMEVYSHHMNKAKAYFSAALKKSKDNSYAHAGFGFCLSQNPDFIFRSDLYEKANISFKKALDKNPNDTTFLNYVGMTEQLMGNYNESIGYLEKAVLLGAKGSEIQNALATSYLKAKKYEQARIYISNAISNSPKDPRYLINAGMIESYYMEDSIISNKSTDVTAFLGRLNKFYNRAGELMMRKDIVEINRAIGYEFALKFDSARFILSRIETLENKEFSNHNDSLNSGFPKIPGLDSLITSAKANNEGVLEALEFKKDMARSKFNLANDFDSEKKYYFISSNLDLLESHFYGKSNKKFTSVFYYFLPISPVKPVLYNQLNIPIVKPELAMPNEREEFFYKEVACTEHFTRHITINKIESVPYVSRKGFKTCSD